MHLILCSGWELFENSHPYLAIPLKLERGQSCLELSQLLGNGHVLNEHDHESSSHEKERNGNKIDTHNKYIYPIYLKNFTYRNRCTTTQVKKTGEKCCITSPRSDTLRKSYQTSERVHSRSHALRERLCRMSALCALRTGARPPC